MKKIYIFLILFLLLNTVNGQDWKWKNPLPAGNKLNCVEFVDSSTAYAIGNFGTIIKTTNGGEDWELQISGTNHNLYSISLIDKDTIYVGGENLSVFKTINGGISWDNVFSYGGSNSTNFIFFVSPAVGYFAGDGTTLFKTVDYGATWTDLDVGIEFQQVTSIFFTSIDTGYASVGHGTGGKTLKTINGGLNWSTINLPLNDSFNKIDFVNDSTGFLVGSSGAILKTIDYGNNWLIQNEFPSAITNSTLLSINFINENIGYIIGRIDILKTIDGGNNWERIAQSNFDLSSVSFADSTHGITVGGDYSYEVSGILTTQNGGIIWNENSSSITTKYIDEIKFVNSDTGYAVGGDAGTYSGFIIKTTDAGDTWSTLNTELDTYSLNDISIQNTDTIYVIAQQGQILKSTDAGSTWIEQNSNTSESLYALNFLNSNNGYAVGENGIIIKTTDGGANWIKLETPTNKHIYTIYFNDINTGYIPVYDWDIDSTILLTTTDGGENWNTKSIGELRSPRKVTFVNNDTAFIVGDFGGILKTIDGGINWEATYYHGNTYMDLFFTDENTAYVVGEDGEISITENCGNNWTVLNSGTDKGLRSIFFTDINTGYVVGGNGVILKTTNSGSSLKPLYQANIVICQGDTILLKPNFIGGTKPISYNWNNNQTTSSVLVAPDNDSVYSVTIKDYELDSIDIEIPIQVISVPTPEINQSGDTLISNIKYGNQWYVDDTKITGAYSNKYIPEIEGKYHTVVSSYPCISDKSNIIDYIVEFVLNMEENKFIIYPNPVSTIINIEFINYDSAYELLLLDVSGRIIKKKNINSTITNVDISDLSSGIYIIQLITNEQILNKRIIKY
ncbi:MAG: T9SS type A sorting domain-containing protein [Bacteroidales bacterium]|nr:T9SS type A sorting domain-containing protein [Bacteroidales bacterium]